MNTSKAARARRRQEAETRNALTPPERRKSARREPISDPKEDPNAA